MGVFTAQGVGHVGRGGGCFTMDFYRLPLDLGGFLAPSQIGTFRA